MPIYFDNGIALVAIIGIVGAMIAFGIVATDHPNWRKPGPWAGVVALWLVGYAVATVIAMIITGVNKPHTPGPEPIAFTYVAEQMGLVSGDTYPLMLGGRIGGSEGETDVSTTVTAGLFSAGATTTMQGSSSPASAVSLGYTYEEKTYILEMPTSRITFIQSETETPSVIVWLRDEQTYDFGNAAYAEYSGDCIWGFNNILWTCRWPEYVETDPIPTISQNAFDVGLAPVVQGGFDRATITLTPDMYRQLLGIIE